MALAEPSDVASTRTRMARRTHALDYYVRRSSLSAMGRRGEGGLNRPNEPKVLVLMSLADGPKHGYALSKDIEEFAGVVLGPGTLYGAITRLEERGLIEPVGEDDRRKPYRITAAGRRSLAAVVRDMHALAAVGGARLRLVLPDVGWAS